MASNSLSDLPRKDAGSAKTADTLGGWVEKKPCGVIYRTYIKALVGGEIDEVVEDERSPPFLVDRATPL